MSLSQDTAPPTPESDDEALELALFAERAYLDYAVSVVKGRALPDVADGQKPVQRRILHAMNQLGLGPTARPVKSARVVGEVLGRFHPHGDTAAYDALVRMAQGFSLRYPLIDGQGNFGSRDGDGAAAMRYTEARLTPYAQLLLAEIDQGTVDFVPNYDGSTVEPALLPARLPMVLLNGASGIAVGMATEIPSHNLREVAAAAAALVRDSSLDLDQILAVMPGPDFPGGGQIISAPADLREIYASGRGSIKVRARFQVEELARGQWQWVVHELPQGVSAARVLEEIEELSNPKVKLGKKALSPEQVQLKQTVLGVLESVRDESGREAPVRLVFEPRSGRIEPQALQAVLLAHTSLEASVSVNLVMISREGRPRQMRLRDILLEWIAFRLETVVRRSRHRLSQVEDRVHLLEGRQQVLLNLDEVIRVIRESDEPKPALRARFALSERQAEDILEIRLRQLARLEALRIEQELDKLRQEQTQLAALLGSEAQQRRLLVKEIEADAKQYGDDRRTLIEAAARTVASIKPSEEPVTVIVSEKGWVRARQGHGHDPAQFSFKSGDAFYGAFEVRTTDTLYVFDSTGRVYAVPVAALPSARGDGAPMTSLIELAPGARIEHAVAATVETRLLLSTRMGQGFVCQAGDLATRNRSGRQFVTLDTNDTPGRPVLIPEGAAWVACLGGSIDQARLLVFALDEVRVLRSGGRGSTLMALGPDESLLQALALGDAGLVVKGIGRGGRMMEDSLSTRALEEYRAARGRRGKPLEPRRKNAQLSAPKPE